MSNNGNASFTSPTTNIPSKITGKNTTIKTILEIPHAALIPKKNNFPKIPNKKIKNNIETVKEKIEEDTKNISDNIKEATSELKENIKNEISVISGISTDKKIFETKKERKHRMTIKVLRVLVVIILLFLWLWASIAFIAGLFAILDGVKIYGINIILFSLMLLTLWALLLVNRTLFKKKLDKMIWFISLLVILFILSLGIALTAYKVSKIDTIKDVSDKYNFTRKYEEYNLPQNESKKFYIYFNSNYNNSLIVLLHLLLHHHLLYLNFLVPILLLYLVNIIYLLM